MKYDSIRYLLLSMPSSIDSRISPLFLVGMQPFATTLFGVPFPLPKPQGPRAQQLKTMPECWIRGLHEASTQGIEATSANLFRRSALGFSKSRRPCRSAPRMLTFRNALVISQPWNRLAGDHARDNHAIGWQAVTLCIVFSCALSGGLVQPPNTAQLIVLNQSVQNTPPDDRGSFDIFSCFPWCCRASVLDLFASMAQDPFGCREPFKILCAGPYDHVPVAILRAEPCGHALVP